MGQDVIILVIFGIVLFIAALFVLLTGKKDKSKLKSSISTEKVTAAVNSLVHEKQKDVTSNITGVQRQAKQVEQRDMSEFIKFDKIANDMIYQNKGQKYTMVIQCKGINYNLMSEIEQMSIEEGFIMFLNTLKFPIQLYVQTRSVDLGENVKKYKERVKEFVNKQNEVTEKYNKIEEDVDATREEILHMRNEKLKYTNIAEYVSDITRYVEKMALNRCMLQRNFYVIVSYSKSELTAAEKFSKEEYEDLCHRELYTRAQGIVTSLAACSISCEILKSNELAQLIYVSLNKDDAGVLNVKDALESGLFRLYTSSEDVIKKKRAMFDEELENQSKQRVEDAVKEAIEKGILVSEERRNEEIQKEIDRRAIKIIDKSNVSEELKWELKDTIKAHRRERLDEIEKKEKEANTNIKVQENGSDLEKQENNIELKADNSINLQKEDTAILDESSNNVEKDLALNNMVNMVINNDDGGQSDV